MAPFPPGYAYVRAVDITYIIGGSRICLGGGLRDKFIRMCTDCIAVKTQLLRWLF